MLKEYNIIYVAVDIDDVCFLHVVSIIWIKGKSFFLFWVKEGKKQLEGI